MVKMDEDVRMRNTEKDAKKYTRGSSRKTITRFLGICLGAFFSWCLLGSWRLPIYAQPQPIQEEDLFTPEDEGSPAPVIEQREPLSSPDDEAHPVRSGEEAASKPTTAESAATTGSENEARLLSQVRQVTFVGQRAGEGYFSQDGSLFVFQSERDPGNPFFQIYLMNLHNGDIYRVSPGVGKATCPWIHPSKKKVLFASTHLDLQAREKQKAEFEKRASGETRRYSW